MRVVIIDDEKNLLDNMCGAIHWNDLNLELAGMATDGISGLELIRRQRPDIVLTDIRMPGLSGLDMIAEAREIVPEAVFIVMSGYSEFSYCSRAIGLGVLDYLEKPITMRTITQCLLNAGNTCAIRKRNNGLLADNLRLKRQSMAHALEQFLTGGNYQDMIQTCGLTGEWEYFMAARDVAVAAVQSPEEAEVSVRYVETLKTVLQEWKPDIGAMSCTLNRTEILVVFSLFDGLDEQSLQDALLRSRGEAPDGVVGLSRVHHTMHDLRAAADEARTALVYARYRDSGEPVRIDQVEYNDWILTNAGDDNTVELNVRTENYDAALAQIRQHLEHIGSLYISPERFRHECLRAVDMVLRLGLEIGFDYVSLTRRIPLAELEPLDTQAEMIGWVARYLEEYFRSLSELPAKHSLIRRAVDYMQRHYMEDITLDSLAEFLQMNPTYLSILFKNEMGTTYVRYLRELRINKAVALLQQGHRAKDVCDMVGYRDYHYFSSWFKKLTGRLPQDFKAPRSANPARNQRIVKERKR